MVRVTVVVPTHNRPQLLGRALDSLAAQTFTDFEVVVVNDGGVDVSEVVNATRGIDVRLINHEVNKGRSAAMNTGIAGARGELVAFLADDDRFYPHHLTTTVRALDALGPGHAVYTYGVQVLESQEGKVLSRQITAGQEFSGDLLLVTNFICGIAVLVPAATLQQLNGFDTSFDVLEDWELWLRVAQSLRWCYVDVPTVEYRLREGQDNSTTREFFRFHPALERVYTKHPLPPESPLQTARDQMLAISKGRSEAYGFDLSVVVAGGNDPDAVMPTLQDVVAVLGVISYEVLLLVPSVDDLGDLLATLQGDVQIYAVGHIGAEEAWEWAANRASGRYLLLLRAGEVVDPALVIAVTAKPAGTATKVGRQPVGC